jgi:hypothetical protein
MKEGKYRKVWAYPVDMTLKPGESTGGAIDESFF